MQVASSGFQGQPGQGGPAPTYVLFPRSAWCHQGLASSTLGLTEGVGYPQLSVSSGASFSVPHLVDGTCGTCGPGKRLVLKSTASTAQQRCPGPVAQGHSWLSPHAVQSHALGSRGAQPWRPAQPPSPQKSVPFLSQGPALLTGLEARPQSCPSKQRPPPTLGDG